MPKITLIGAGSTIFAKNLIGDILSFPELSSATLVLHDIDEQRLRTSEVVANKLALSLNAQPTIRATLNRQEALEGADYAICMIQVGGYKPSTLIDFEIPKKYGLRQTIGDTIGIGGIMRGLRTIPVLLDICKDMEQLCPEVTFLQYVNPMAINCWAIARASSISTIGLCHSVQETATALAGDIHLPINEINFVCAGINHMAFFLQFERDGEDLYPRVRQVLESGDIPMRPMFTAPIADSVRYEVFKRLGYFVTESSEHFAEYVPWFIKRDRPDLIDQYGIPLDEYLDRCEVQISQWETQRAKLEDPTAVLEHQQSSEYGSLIIHSLETGTPRVINGNVQNSSLIDNLPDDCCVEVPCLVDKNGIQPLRLGKLPPQLAALMRTNINVQELTVEAALTQNREHIYHAAMLDPHTAAELSIDEICQLVDELINAHGDWLSVFSH